VLIWLKYSLGVIDGTISEKASLHNGDDFTVVGISGKDKPNIFYFYNTIDQYQSHKPSVPIHIVVKMQSKNLS
jgi:hypothetical protein